MGFARIRPERRRRLLLALTALTVLFPLLGGWLIRPRIESNPLVFVLFWGACLLGVITILVLAVIDLRLSRREIRERRREIDGELVRLVEEAEKAARREVDGAPDER